jgi:hypothetical protein
MFEVTFKSNQPIPPPVTAKGEASHIVPKTKAILNHKLESRRLQNASFLRLFHNYIMSVNLYLWILTTVEYYYYGSIALRWAFAAFSVS